MGQFLQSQRPRHHGWAGNSSRSTTSPKLAVSRDAAPPLGHVAFLVQPRRRLHRYNCLAATASPAAKRAHLLSFRLSRELSAPWAGLPHAPTHARASKISGNNLAHHLVQKPTLQGRSMAQPQTPRRDLSAAASVPSSRWSSSPPIGIPWARRVTSTPLPSSWSAM